MLTGAAKLTGLGHAFSKGLAAAGANIVVADTLDGSAAIEAIRSLGVRAFFVECDVGSEDDVANLAAIVYKEFGACDILVHGASPFRHKPVEEMRFADWRAVLGANLDGMFLLSRELVPGMKRRRWGRVIAISSAAYQAGAGGRSNYLSAKAGLIGFVRSLAREVGDFGITVNALAPGLVRTEREGDGEPFDKEFSGRDKYQVVREQQCVRKTLTPEALVGPLLFFASEDSAYVTGQTLLVDGGWRHLG